MTEETATPAPSPSRCIYGFVMYIACCSCLFLYSLWVLTPSSWLVFLGLEYFTSKYFAIALPATICTGIIVFGFLVYPAVNLLLTHPPDSINVLIDEESRQPLRPDFYYPASKQALVNGIPPVSDLDVEQTCKILYRRRLK